MPEGAVFRSAGTRRRASAAGFADDGGIRAGEGRNAGLQRPRTSAASLNPPEIRLAAPFANGYEKWRLNRRHAECNEPLPVAVCLRIKAVDKCTDEADRIARVDMPVRALRKQQGLRTVISGNMCHGQVNNCTWSGGIPPRGFSHSLDRQRNRERPQLRPRCRFSQKNFSDCRTGLQ